MTANIHRLLALCCLCLVGGSAIPQVAAASWVTPNNANDQRDFVSSLLQGSDCVVVARVDSSTGRSHGMVRCTALEYLKGNRFRSDLFSYCDHGDPPPVGGKYLLYLTRSVPFGLVLTWVPIKYEIRDDDTIYIRNRNYTVPWPVYRDSLVQELASLTSLGLASTAEFVVRGTITKGSLLQTRSRAHGQLGIRVLANYSTPPLADSNSVILLDIPPASQAWFKWLQLPLLAPGLDVVLFLDHNGPGLFSLHGDLYGVWSVSGDTARVAFPDPVYPLELLHVLAAEPVDSLRTMVQSHRPGK